MADALLGGIFIGIAASLMMLFNGRVAGISGILAGILRPRKGDTVWRLSFVFGLLVGGVVLRWLRPEVFVQFSSARWGDYVFAGLLVGFGTLMGNGCTSGHGVCGIARLSTRSMTATFVFILFGVLGLLIFKILRGGL